MRMLQGVESEAGESGRMGRGFWKAKTEILEMFGSGILEGL